MLGPGLVKNLPMQNWDCYGRVLADPTDADAWRALADWTFSPRVGKWEVRWAGLMKQAQLTNAPDAWTMLAALYRQHRFLPEALTTARHALRLAPRSASAWLTYGHVLAARKAYWSARRAYRIAWRLDPQDDIAAEFATGVRFMVPGRRL